MENARILIISHGHPDFSAGGSETAAYAHWRELRRQGIEAMLICRVANSPGHAGTPFFSRSDDGLEVLFSPPAVDHFRHSQPQGKVIYEDFSALLKRFKPTVVHFHHYAHMGLELIREVRKFDNDVPVFLTLHEFLAICHAQGQMLKTNGTLCRRAAPIDCHLCFPEIPPQTFFMRELFIKSFLSLVDAFVCPSEFLRDRYIAWGVPEDKLVLLENGQPRHDKRSGEDPSDQSYERRFVLLGQISRRKGTLLLLEAIKLLPKTLRKSIKVELHGSAQYAEEGFQAKLERALLDLRGTVTLCGPYASRDVFGIIRRSGWVLVPSIWWENSPTVIQEAFTAGRPVICSDIGGMAEKVANGVNGIHFRVANAVDLAMRIEQCATNPGLWKQLCAGVPQPPAIHETVGTILDLYQRTMGNRRARSGNPLRKLEQANVTRENSVVS